MEHLRNELDEANKRERDIRTQCKRKAIICLLCIVASFINLHVVCFTLSSLVTKSMWIINLLIVDSSFASKIITYECNLNEGHICNCKTLLR